MGVGLYFDDGLSEYGDSNDRVGFGPEDEGYHLILRPAGRINLCLFVLYAHDTALHACDKGWAPTHSTMVSAPDSSEPPSALLLHD